MEKVAILLRKERREKTQNHGAVSLTSVVEVIRKN